MGHDIILSDRSWKSIMLNENLSDWNECPKSLLHWKEFSYARQNMSVWKETLVRRVCMTGSENLSDWKYTCQTEKQTAIQKENLSDKQQICQTKKKYQTERLADKENLVRQKVNLSDWKTVCFTERKSVRLKEICQTKRNMSNWQTERKSIRQKEIYQTERNMSDQKKYVRLADRKKICQTEGNLSDWKKIYQKENLSNRKETC